MTAKLETSLLILPVTDLEKTSVFYSKLLGFRAVKYLQVQQPHICLYRDAVEIILTQSKLQEIQPNRIIHGYGYDGYFTGKNIESIYEELVAKNVKIVRPLGTTDYGNLEFVMEDIDGRWICFGVKTATIK
ncbi:MAG: VOC family protein [Candidatus Babeliales bacterium]|jgi:catechol 2,3-dioxygenase-like lactoylglutathione lyase family enzyme